MIIEQSPLTSDSIFDASAALLDRDFDAELLDAVVAHWATTFAADERGDDIARKLGLSPSLASTLGIGLSDRSLGLCIPSRELKAGRLLRERLEALGVLRASGHEAFRGCVVVPVRRDGRVVALFARRLDHGSSVQWATGLPGGVYHSDSWKCDADRSGTVEDSELAREPRSRASLDSR